MTRYTAESHLADLTDFQRRSVDHVFNQFYGSADAQRFLVADETGLGKTRVAQGVIARAIEHLQNDDSVGRIDVVYVCANSDLARQNIKRLNVTGQLEIPFSSRLTMLGAHSRRLRKQKASVNGKAVNLVSFTPGTSFEMGHSLGMASERAMILLALDEIVGFAGWPWRTALLLLKGQVGSIERFEDVVDAVRHEVGDDGIDPAILKSFTKAISSGGKAGLLGRFEALSDEVGRKWSLPDHLYAVNADLVRELRATLARASVQTLEPDLVILDEFQRFRHLLDESTAAGELAHHLFEYEAAKVLLLSATPYKPFTYAGEDGEDHAKDLFATLGFLAKGRSDVDVEDIRDDLRTYRDAVLGQGTTTDVVSSLRSNLLKIMSRAERPVLPEGSMQAEKRKTADDLRAEDLAGYSRLTRLARLVADGRDRNLVNAEYWKSSPYFVNFCDGYQLGTRLDNAERTNELRRSIHATQQIRSDAIQSFLPLEPGNARMRSLTADTIERDWWRLLWVPPSLPYFEPAGPYADAAVQGMTKRLVFSSWTATPTAVATLLSYEAERRAAKGTDYSEYTPEARKRVVRHLGYDLKDGSPAKMATLLLHWPMPELAKAADPLVLVAENGGVKVMPAEARARIQAAIERLWPSAPESPDRSASRESELRETVWRAAFGLPGNWPGTSDGVTDSQIALALEGEVVDEGDEDSVVDAKGIAGHVAQARQALGSETVGVDTHTAATMTEVALFSPANVAYRSLRRIAGTAADISEWGIFEAAAHLANGLRSLFQRPATVAFIESLSPAGTGAPYWRHLLAYCADGNLEAVLDEYLHHLAADEQGRTLDNHVLLSIAREAAAAIGLRGATYRIKDPAESKKTMPFAPRFALRYGGRQQDAEDVRQPEVRRSFNSPFWPMVLASTSVGQEGIDFHWWCHAVFHWNTPANPVDFEQRQGRVDRYRGHAVRKNVAARHGTSVLANFESVNPWDRVYEAATEYRADYGDFSPGWVYPGAAKIESHVAPFPLSSDDTKYDRMKQDVALYRLTFGQPRQEDMLELLHHRGVQTNPDLLKGLRIDLAP